MTVTDDCPYEYLECFEELELAPIPIILNPRKFIYQLIGLGIAFSIFIMACSRSNGWFIFTLYALFCMIIVEMNFQDLGLDSTTRAYCRDFSIVMFMGLFVRFYWFKYLWLVSVISMFHKHRTLIIQEMRKIPNMSFTTWIFLGFVLIPLCIKMIV